MTRRAPTELPPVPLVGHGRAPNPAWLLDRPVPALLAGYRADWQPRTLPAPPARPTRRGGRSARGLGRILPGQVFGAGEYVWTTVEYDVRIGRWAVVGRDGKTAFMSAKELRTA